MKTLEELKAENAKKEVEATEVPPTEEAETEIEAAEVEPVETEEAGESNQDEAEETEVEAWMQAEDQTSEDGDTVVPLAAHTKMRGKLKARISEKDEELEKLKAEIEALKTQRTQPKQTNVARPKPEDFDYDDEKYSAALDAYYDAKLEAKLSATTQTTQQKQQEQAVRDRLNQAVDSHYQRAAELATKSGISADLYQDADLTVRQTIERVLPNMGDTVTDQLIARLGEGSEKVMYFLGRNKAAQLKLEGALREDPTGISAALYLGELKTSVAAPAKRVSRAPAPASEVRGDENGSLSATSKKLKEAYIKAHKGGRLQDAYNARKKAREAGIDVSNW